ncbi:MAG TPA: TA system VapC family ribonuclease toxin [Mycobacterium sp.]|uniref:TA system VapC family ribonuclease toxin n=1 Tax=Mycobacterium sp. TaxID=1785 RepID=UPI002D244F5E|nr:TA system VapC family ribonuclease toxin [Mycobacterium sp.]HZU46244.1 TA system VapC family ribonuclease toxin [Mycobacterium sp.]
MTVALLDVNVLVALTWPNHVHHQAARRWFDAHSRAGWATTPITELGFVRVSSNKKVIPEAATPATALSVLRSLCALPGHEFWTDGARLVDPPFAVDRIGAHQQLTDVHLAALAVSRKGKLVTFDRGIAQALPPTSQAVVEVLPVV